MLPARCSNLYLVGPKNNRLYMASCHSLYTLYVEARGVVQEWPDRTDKQGRTCTRCEYKPCLVVTHT